MNSGHGVPKDAHSAVGDERTLLSWLMHRQTLQFSWSPLQEATVARLADLMLAGRLVFPNRFASEQLKIRLEARETPRLWLERPSLSPEMREKFTDILHHVDWEIERIAGGRIELCPLDLETVLVAKLTRRSSIVSALRYPYLPCGGMFPAVVECGLDASDEDSGPILVHDGTTDLERTYREFDNVTRTLQSRLSWTSYRPSRTAQGSQTAVEASDIIQVRYLSHLPRAWDDTTPSMGLFHIASSPDPDLMPELIRRMRADRVPGLILYSPGAVSIETQLESLGVPCWRVPRTALASLQGDASGNGREAASPIPRYATSKGIAEAGWKVNALPITDRQLNWAFSGLVAELARFSEVADAGEDNQLDVTISSAWRFLVATEATTAPIAQLDRQLSRTRFGFPIARRLERVKRSLGTFEAANPDFSQEVDYLEQLCDIIVARLSTGESGKPAATLQLVQAAQRSKSAIVVVTCSDAMARSTDAFLNFELEKVGSAEGSSWLVVSASQVLRHNVSELLSLAGIPGGRDLFLVLPVCRHDSHNSLFGFPLARRVVALLYQSQAGLYRRNVVSETQDVPSKVDSDRNRLMQTWCQGDAVPVVATHGLSNIVASPSPMFPEGRIIPTRKLGDVVREVSVSIKASMDDAALARDAELRQSSQPAEARLAAASARGEYVDALLILLDDGLQVYMTPQHRVFVVDEERGDVNPTLVRDLEPGYRVLASGGSMEYSLDQSLLELLSDSPEWASQVRYRSMWVETLTTWMERPGSTNAKFLRELSALGSQIRTEQAIQFWRDDIVIGPKDDNDIGRIAQICDSPKLKRYSDTVISSIHDLRGIRQQVVQAVVRAALQGRVDRMSQGVSAGEDREEDSQIERFVKETTIHLVRAIGDMRSMDIGFLNVITKAPS
jgi:hypothetical protein